MQPKTKYTGDLFYIILAPIRLVKPLKFCQRLKDNGVDLNRRYFFINIFNIFFYLITHFLNLAHGCYLWCSLCNKKYNYLSPLPTQVVVAISSCFPGLEMVYF